MKIRLKRERLFRFIAEHGWSLNQFSRMAGLKPGHLSQMISGKRNPSPNTQMKLLREVERRSSTPIGFDFLFEIEGAAEVKVSSVADRDVLPQGVAEPSN